MVKRATETRENRNLFELIWAISAASWLGSVILVFGLALAAHLATGAHEPLDNSVWLAITGGYAGAGVPSPWNWAVGVTCVMYAASGSLVLVSTIAIMLRGLTRLARGSL